MERYIHNNTAPWTSVGTRLSQVDSTSAELLRRLRRGRSLANGTSVRADYQSAGRGRHGRHWEATPGDNLAVSYALSGAGLAPERLFALSQTTALAVRDVIDAYAPHREVTVKWPNDIYVGQHKVAGLLLESTLQQERISCAVVGIGINVNQVAFSHAPRATSLSLLTGRRHSVTDLWQHLTATLQSGHEHLSAAVVRGDLYPLQREYHAHLFGLGKLSRYRDLPVGTVFAARLIGVTPDGRLRLDRAGEEALYTLDEVHWDGYIQSQAGSHTRHL